MTQSRPEPKVIVIPAKEESPQDQEKKKNLRVAAYCRVSTKKDEQLNSYENQKAYYTEKIMANPDWTMADIFADEGITGTSACKRKDFLRMIRQCRQGKIDMILAKSVSRFARNTVDTLNYTRELRGMGIPVIFEEQNINSIYPESEFLITITVPSHSPKVRASPPVLSGASIRRCERERRISSTRPCWAMKRTLTVRWW